MSKNFTLSSSIILSYAHKIWVIDYVDRWRRAEQLVCWRQLVEYYIEQGPCTSHRAETNIYRYSDITTNPSCPNRDPPGSGVLFWGVSVFPYSGPSFRKQNAPALRPSKQKWRIVALILLYITEECTQGAMQQRRGPFGLVMFLGNHDRNIIRCQWENPRMSRFKSTQLRITFPHVHFDLFFLTRRSFWWGSSWTWLYPKDNLKMRNKRTWIIHV